ncbi:PTS system mannose/fructose/sorbose family transporter subunit IID [Clostridium tarantellae]|uniref:PTS N-acetylgalactosamine transporter subunit IID n=1 Tax=Clostridium tarantellae TaxID=39493 RepID=A0A6I1MP79_9CLOT|nr:PTS system mannose/fructose/sorbose family transporter subunit IID [Clostridium tarantellae]MPQ44874.1 PTS N-acetylgalactosamine transporter subunit IID [Clostridium tarantellae]
MESNKSLENSPKEKVITKKVINEMIWRSLLLQASFNYERMQACGWLYSLIPTLRRVHKDEYDLSTAMKEHMEFFNTHPFLVTFIIGLVASMEESHQDRSTIRSIKVATMGPLGGIGDALFWLTLLPICSGIGASLAIQGNIAGPIIFLVLFNTIHFIAIFGLGHYGYNTGVKAIASLKEQTKNISHAASILGLTVVGGLIASYVNLKTPLVIKAGEAKIPLQTDMLDKILPNLLPLAYTFLMFYLLKKGISPVKLIIITVIIGIVGKYCWIL